MCMRQGEAGIFATTMQIKVTGKNLDVGDALREHIEEPPAASSSRNISKAPSMPT